MYHHDIEDSHVAAILENPAAPSLAAALNTALEAEKQRRQQFYHDIDDDMKAEFINGDMVVHSPVKRSIPTRRAFCTKSWTPSFGCCGLATSATKR